MKKFFKTVTVALCIAVAASSCGTMLLNNSNSGTNLTNVELSHANYRIVKNVEGFSSASYVFGIGGLSRKATRDNAVADMMRKARLTGSQAIVNVHIKNHLTSVLGIYMRLSCSATAQVIEFLPESNTGIKTQIEPTPHHHTQETTEYIPAETTITVARYQSSTEFQKYYDIGDMYDDGTIKGYVFEVSEDGRHGKIVYPQAITRAQWCTKEQISNMPATNDEYDGETNMEIIRKRPNWHTNFPAFAACAQLGTKWYLPSKHELESLCNLAKDKGIADLRASDAWSSTINKAGSVKTLCWNRAHATNKMLIIAVAKF